MILLFLGNWRSTLIIAISIPLSILTSVILLSAIGETFNIMTLGGLALAVGVLVDDATVELENIERNLGMKKELKRAILDGAQQIAVPALYRSSVSSSFPCSSDGCSVICSYPGRKRSSSRCWRHTCSRTLVPTLVMYLLKGTKKIHRAPTTMLGRFQASFENRLSVSDSYRNTLNRSWDIGRSSLPASSRSACCPGGWHFFWAGTFSPTLTLGNSAFMFVAVQD
jgi:multidrug efflux pump subunit AcrB